MPANERLSPAGQSRRNCRPGSIVPMKGFQTATQMLQGIEAAPEADRGRMFAAVRPRLVEALPAFEQYIPPTLEQDPGFVSRAIPFGLSVSELAAKRKDVVDKLNETFTKAGNTLERDTAVLGSLGTWLEDAATGEEVKEALKTAETLYGASPAVRQRIGEVPPGPLTPEAKSALLATFTTHKTPESIDAAILAADRAGDTKEKNRLLGLKKQMSAAGREDSPESVTTSRQAETWRANQYADLEDRRLKAGTQQYNFATSRMETIPTITDAQVRVRARAHRARLCADSRPGRRRCGVHVGAEGRGRRQR